MLVPNNQLKKHLSPHPYAINCELQVIYGDDSINEFTSMGIKDLVTFLKRCMNRTNRLPSSDNLLYSKHLSLTLNLHSLTQETHTRYTKRCALVPTELDVVMDSIDLEKTILRTAKEVAQSVIGQAPWFEPINNIIDFEIKPEDIKGILIEGDTNYSVLISLGLPESFKVNETHTTKDTLTDFGKNRILQVFMAKSGLGLDETPELTNFPCVPLNDEFYDFVISNSKLTKCTPQEFTQKCLLLASGAMGLRINKTKPNSDNDEFVTNK